MIIEGLEQQTPEWLHMRCGMCTASRVIDVVTKLKKGDYSKKRADYLMELVVERLTGRSADKYVTQWMEEGIENEPFARAAYEVVTGADLQPVGFAIHPRIEFFGASPDSLVGEDGLIEIKCLKSSNHLDIISGGVVPEEYAPQMLAEMACAERKWCDFVSFDPRMPKHLQLFIRRFEWNDKLVELMEKEVVAFLAEVKAKLAELAEIKG